MEQKQRSIILEIDDARQELIQCVNNIMAQHRLPCYLIEPMFAEMYDQIRASARNELAQARAAEAERNAAQKAKDGAE